MLDSPAESENPIPPASRVRPVCRWYAGVIAVLQLALIVMLAIQGTSFSLLSAAIFCLPLLGAALIAVDQPVGRSVFVPTALLQIVVIGFLGLIVFACTLLGLGSKTTSAQNSALIYSGCCAFSILYLAVGIRMFVTSLRRN